ncbi:MAG: chemotaxis protein CheW [Paracoccus sp. (in: a-proteobacteria)]|uniref:chemotaxis protein CheW n=1 Tax=Paracoccus sp. TaxID=267 RepID=UPI0026DF04C4|nr:chemotaxis protein CheW [Paracoccus sp. (in: a-proteobacteria)]MDO5622026.1 chemotaxis protein CheW [Paracoccus sp. (in: a-proteobacteria)]
MNQISDIEPAETELLSFRLGDQEYCIEIMAVREIRGWTPATPIPYAPPHLCGVINLRGTVLPVLDLAQRLGMPPVQTTDTAVIIIVSVRDCSVGLLVDAVSDIVSVPTANLQIPPEMPSDAHADFLKALTLLDERMIRVLNLDTVIPKPLERS